jgi:hypothetical protein
LTICVPLTMVPLLVATDLGRTFAEGVAAGLSNGARTADAGPPGNRRRQGRQGIGRRLPLAEPVAAKHQRDREVAGQLRDGVLLGAMLRPRALPDRALKVAARSETRTSGAPPDGCACPVSASIR